MEYSDYSEFVKVSKNNGNSIVCLMYHIKIFAKYWGGVIVKRLGLCTSLLVRVHLTTPQSSFLGENTKIEE